MNVELKRLRNLIIEIASGGRPKGGATDKGVFSIGAEHLDGLGSFDLSNAKYIPTEYFNLIGNGRIKTNDVLLVKDGATTGKVSFVSENFPFEKAAINEHVYRIEFNCKLIYPKYAYYYLASKEGQRSILSDFRGATVGGISKGILDKIHIPLFPLTIQKRIIDILDTAKALNNKERELQKKYGNLVQATFIEMFGDFNDFEQKYESQPLKNLIVSGDKINYGVVQPGDDFPGGVPIVRVGDIEGAKINSSKLKTIDPKIERKHEKSRLKGDEILLACVGATIGKIALVDNSLIGFNIVRATARVRCDETKINRYFLLYYLKTPVMQHYLINSARTSSQPTLNIEQIEEAKIILPDLKLQNKFGAIIQNIELQNTKANLVVKKSEELFEALLEKSFKGELIKKINRDLYEETT